MHTTLSEKMACSFGDAMCMAPKTCLFFFLKSHGFGDRKIPLDSSKCVHLDDKIYFGDLEHVFPLEANIRGSQF